MKRETVSTRSVGKLIAFAHNYVEKAGSSKTWGEVCEEASMSELVPEPKFEVGEAVVFPWMSNDEGIHIVQTRHWREYSRVWSYRVHDGTSSKWWSESSLAQAPRTRRQA